MLEIIKGREDYEFVKFKNNVSEVINYFRTKDEKTILWIDFSACSESSILELLNTVEINCIQSLHFFDSSELVRNFQALSHWKYLSFGYPNSIFNFNNQSSLRHIGSVWSKKWIALSLCSNLESFCVSGYQGDFLQLPNLSNLKKIELIQPSIVNLNGIEVAIKLEVLELSYAKKLEDISMLSERNSQIKKLVIDRCKKIKSYKSLSSLNTLEYLQILSCNPVDAISSAEHLPNLKFKRIT